MAVDFEFTIPLASSSDDAEEKVVDGAVSLTSSDLELGYEGTDEKIVGLRFLNLKIAPNSTLNSSYIQFEADETNSSATTVRIYGQLSTSPATFTTTDSDVSSRVKTTAYVDWTPPAWDVVQERGVDQRTPDLNPILDELISQSGWDVDSDVVFIIENLSGTGTRTAEKENAELYINFNTSQFEYDYQINNKYDDSEEKVDDGTIDITSSDLEFGFEDENEKIVCVRFNGILINNGNIPKNVFIQFETDEVGSASIVTRIYGELSSNSSELTTTAYDVSSRTKTATSVLWDIPAWDVVQERGALQKTPDLSSIMEEIVSQAGWVAGNSVSFIFELESGTGTRTAESYNSSTSGSAVLHTDFDVFLNALDTPSVITQNIVANSPEVIIFEYDSIITIEYPVEVYIQPNDVVIDIYYRWTIAEPSASELVTTPNDVNITIFEHNVEVYPSVSQSNINGQTPKFVGAWEDYMMLDLLQDGSGSHLWMFDDNLKDEGISTLESTFSPAYSDDDGLGFGRYLSGGGGKFYFARSEDAHTFSYWYKLKYDGESGFSLLKEDSQEYGNNNSVKWDTSLQKWRYRRYSGNNHYDDLVGATPVKGKWIHVCISWKKYDTCIIWVDGTKNDIGDRGFEFFDELYLSGHPVDQIRILNRKITDDEYTLIHTETAPSINEIVTPDVILIQSNIPSPKWRTSSDLNSQDVRYKFDGNGFDYFGNHPAIGDNPKDDSSLNDTTMLYDVDNTYARPTEQDQEYEYPYFSIENQIVLGTEFTICIWLKCTDGNSSTAVGITTGSLLAGKIGLESDDAYISWNDGWSGADECLILRRNGIGNDVTLFRNGVEESITYTGTLADSFSVNTISRNGNDWTINKCFVGNLYDMAVYDRALTITEIEDYTLLDRNGWSLGHPMDFTATSTPVSIQLLQPTIYEDLNATRIKPQTIQAHIQSKPITILGTVEFDAKWEFTRGYNEYISKIPIVSTNEADIVNSGLRLKYFSEENATLFADGKNTVFDTQSFTISMFFKISYQYTNAVLLSYDYTAHADPYYSIHIRRTSEGSIFFGTNYNGVSKTLSTADGVTNLDQEHHLIVTVKYGEQKIYIDNVLVGSGTEVGSITFYNQPIWIGEANYDNPSFDGTIRNLRHYDHVVDSAERQNIIDEDTPLKELITGVMDNHPTPYSDGSMIEVFPLNESLKSSTTDATLEGSSFTYGDGLYNSKCVMFNNTTGAYIETTVSGLGGDTEYAVSMMVWTGINSSSIKLLNIQVFGINVDVYTDKVLNRVEDSTDTMRYTNTEEWHKLSITYDNHSGAYKVYWDDISGAVTSAGSSLSSTLFRVYNYDGTTGSNTQVEQICFLNRSILCWEHYQIADMWIEGYAPPNYWVLIADLDITESVSSNIVYGVDIVHEVIITPIINYDVVQEIQDASRAMKEELFNIWQGLDFDWANVRDIDGTAETIIPAVGHWKLENDLTDEFGFRDLTCYDQDMKPIFVDEPEMGMCYYSPAMDDTLIVGSGINGEEYTVSAFAKGSADLSLPTKTLVHGDKWIRAFGDDWLPLRNIRFNKPTSFILTGKDGKETLYVDGNRVSGRYHGEGNDRGLNLNYMFGGKGTGFVKNVQVWDRCFIESEIYRVAYADLNSVKQLKSLVNGHKDIIEVDLFKITHEDEGYLVYNYESIFMLNGGVEGDVKKWVDVESFNDEKQFSIRNRWTLNRTLDDAVGGNHLEIVSGTPQYRLLENGRYALHAKIGNNFTIRTKLKIDTTYNLSMMIKVGVTTDSVIERRDNPFLSLGTDSLDGQYNRRWLSLYAPESREFGINGVIANGIDYHCRLPLTGGEAIMYSGTQISPRFLTQDAYANPRWINDPSITGRVVFVDGDFYGRPKYNIKNFATRLSTKKYEDYLEISFTNMEYNYDIQEIIIFDDVLYQDDVLLAEDVFYNREQIITQRVEADNDNGYEPITIIDEFLIVSNSMGDTLTIMKKPTKMDLLNDGSCYYGFKINSEGIAEDMGGSAEYLSIRNISSGTLFYDKKGSPKYTNGAFYVGLNGKRNRGNWIYQYNRSGASFLPRDREIHRNGFSFSFDFTMTGLSGTTNNTIMALARHKVTDGSFEESIGSHSWGNQEYGLGLVVYDIGDEYVFKFGEGDDILVDVHGYELARVMKHDLYMNNVKIVISCDSDEVVTMYIDGVIAGREQFVGIMQEETINSKSWKTFPKNLHFGGTSTESIEYRFHYGKLCGVLDNLRLFSRELNYKEVDILKNEGLEITSFSQRLDGYSIDEFIITSELKYDFPLVKDYNSSDYFGDGSQVCLLDPTVGYVQRRKMDCRLNGSFRDKSKVVPPDYMRVYSDGKPYIVIDDIYVYYATGIIFEDTEWTLSWSTLQKSSNITTQGEEILLGIGFTDMAGMQESMFPSVEKTPVKQNVFVEGNDIVMSGTATGGLRFNDTVQEHYFDDWIYWSLSCRKVQNGYYYTLWINRKPFTIFSEIRLFIPNSKSKKSGGIVEQGSFILAVSHNNGGTDTYNTTFVGTVRLFNKCLKGGDIFSLINDGRSYSVNTVFDIVSSNIQNQEILIESEFIRSTIWQGYFTIESSKNTALLIPSSRCLLWTFDKTLYEYSGQATRCEIPYYETPYTYNYVDAKFNSGLVVGEKGLLWKIEDGFNIFPLASDESGSTVSFQWRNDGYIGEQGIFAFHGRNSGYSFNRSFFWTTPQVEFKFNNGQIIMEVLSNVYNEPLKYAFDVPNEDEFQSFVFVFSKRTRDDVNEALSYRNMVFYLDGVNVWSGEIATLRYGNGTLQQPVALVIGSTDIPINYDDNNYYGEGQCVFTTVESKGILDQVRLFEYDFKESEIPMLVDEIVVATSNEIMQTIQKFNIEVYDIINVIEPFEIKYLFISQEVKHGNNIIMFNTTQAIEVEYKSIFIKREEV